MPPELSTEAPITTPAAPAPMSPPVAAPASVINPVQTMSTTTTPAVPLADAYEQRVRHFQSEADRLRTEAERKAQELAQAKEAAETARREAEALRATHDSVLASMQQAQQSAIAQIEELRRAREQDQAEAKKAKMLLEEGYQQLAPYANFVTATTDDAKLREQLDALKAARERDLAAQPVAQSVTPAPQPPAFSRPATPALQPARPQPQAEGQTGVNEQIVSLMQQARAQLEANQITIVEYEQKMSQVRELANAEVRRQHGMAQ